MLYDSNKNIKWFISSGLTSYPQALHTMRRMQEEVFQHQADEMIWLVEHPPVYTAGISADEKEILHTASLPIYKTGRGGKITWHGPGQRVVYLIMDLRHRGKNIRKFIHQLEDWIILTLAQFRIEARKDEEHIGIWVEDHKVAAIGIQLRRWITCHGIAINIHPDLGYFDHIIPCGIHDKAVSGLHALGYAISMDMFDAALKASFLEAFQIPSANLQSHNFFLPHNGFS